MATRKKPASSEASPAADEVPFIWATPPGEGVGSLPPDGEATADPAVTLSEQQPHADLDEAPDSPTDMPETRDEIPSDHADLHEAETSTLGTEQSDVGVPLPEPMVDDTRSAIVDASPVDRETRESEPLAPEPPEGPQPPSGPVGPIAVRGLGLPPGVSARLLTSAPTAPAHDTSLDSASVDSGSSREAITERIETERPATPSSESDSGSHSDGLDSHPGADSSLPAQPGLSPSATPTSTDSAKPTAVPRGSVTQRSVTEAFAERLDSGTFFSALFDLTFTKYISRRMAGPVYVVGLTLIGLFIIYGFGQSLASAISTHSVFGVLTFLFGVLVTLVAGMMCVLVLRVLIEVVVAVIEIAENTRPRRKKDR